jgi:hypothetical protein
MMKTEIKFPIIVDLLMLLNVSGIFMSETDKKIDFHCLANSILICLRNSRTNYC